MKRFLFIMFSLFLITAAIMHAQITSESKDNFDNGFYSYNVEGGISGTDTLFTKAFRMGTQTKIFDVFALGTQTNDSIKLKLVRQVSYLGTAWTTDKTIGTDSVKTEKAWADTSSYFNVIHRIAIVGVTGNGYKTNFRVKISAKRE